MFIDSVEAFVSALMVSESLQATTGIQRSLTVHGVGYHVSTRFFCCPPYFDYSLTIIQPHFPIPHLCVWPLVRCICALYSRLLSVNHHLTISFTVVIILVAILSTHMLVPIHYLNLKRNILRQETPNLNRKYILLWQSVHASRVVQCCSMTGTHTKPIQ